MNIFFEFDKILKTFQNEKVKYALAGGLAVAFYSIPRFTKDIDFLIKEDELKKISNILIQHGYFASSKPWKFRNTELVLHRYMKIEDQDEMIIDILVSGNLTFDRIVDEAEIYKSEKIGDVRLVTKKDLIDMKRIRNSAQDKADIERLQDEEE